MSAEPQPSPTPKATPTATPRRWRPPPALLGFLVLLVAVFAVSYQVGSSVGPVAPGMRSSTSDGDGGGGGGGGSQGGHGGH